MSFFQEVDANSIRETVMSALASASTEVLATMDVADELSSPLPDAYYNLLEKKVRMGVRVVRLGFGTAEQIGIFIKRRAFQHLGYQFMAVSHGDYRRMILIDRQRLFFSTVTDGMSRFFSTDDASRIAIYLEYFRKFQ